MLNTKVAIIDNGFSYDDFSSKVKVINYDTLDSLNKAISELKDANFSVVIDLTNLYKYKIVDDELISEEYRLPLGELFPNSEIITTSEKENVDDKCNEIKKLIKNR